ncbi:1995_t:CDS:2, partial [Funneliformis caledonium]
MNKWDSDPILEYKESLENDMMNYDSITEDNNEEFADFNNQSDSSDEGDNQDEKDSLDDKVNTTVPISYNSLKDVKIEVI